MSPRASSNRPTRRRRPLRLEPLERRELLSVSVYMDSDVLRIYGTDTADTVTISGYTNAQNEYWVAVTANGVTDQFAAAPIRKIYGRMLGGDDYFRNDSSVASHVWGNSGIDTLIGGSGADRLFGGSWNDELYGQGGNDFLVGGGANDTIYGGSGNDRLYGQSGSDQLYGEGGNDSLIGSSGSDLLDGGDGDDYVSGHTGQDSIYGQAGNDRLYGSGADDLIYGGSGNDKIYGGGQNDRLYGEAGRDTLLGTRGDNELYGGDDADRLYGGLNNDSLFGEAGDDLLRGLGGNDTLYGGDGVDRLYGGDNDDHLYGGGGADSLYGEAGQDGLFGGDTAQGDSLNGGGDSDRFLTQTGDTIADYGSTDAEVQFVDGTSSYTQVPAVWTDAEIERADYALARLQVTAGTALILRDSYQPAKPVKMYIAESFTMGGGVIGFNWYNGIERQIHIRTGLNDESFAATVVHEYGHNWDSSSEGNTNWSLFDGYHNQSSVSADYSRSYGQTNAKEDWTTNWEYFFGYYHWAGPATPSSLLLAKQAAVQDFFANFTGV